MSPRENSAIRAAASASADLPERPELARILRLARLLDRKYRIPGTSVRFGLDGLIGLVPGVGDAVTTAMSVLLLWEARRLGVRPATWARLGLNIAVDALVGAVPLVGDVFDVFFKANLRNAELLQREVEARHRRGFRDS